MNLFLDQMSLMEELLVCEVTIEFSLSKSTFRAWQGPHHCKMRQPFNSVLLMNELDLILIIQLVVMILKRIEILMNSYLTLFLQESYRSLL